MWAFRSRSRFGPNPSVKSSIKIINIEPSKTHADRFWWFTDHVDPLRPGYLDDLHKDFDAGAGGVKLLPWFHGVLPDHPGLIRVFELCSKLHKPVDLGFLLVVLSSQSALR